MVLWSLSTSGSPGGQQWIPSKKPEGNQGQPKGLGVQVVALYPVSCRGAWGWQENPTSEYLSLSLVSLAGFWWFLSTALFTWHSLLTEYTCSEVLSPPPSFSWGKCFPALCLPPVVTAEPHKASTWGELLTYHTAMPWATKICSLFCLRKCKNIII